MTDLATAVDPDERKRLGQFFTGEPLARVLAALASAASASSLLDPMAGSGDMLVAARAVGATAAHMTAVEIDPLAAGTCIDRLGADLGGIDVRTADAFDPTTWSMDPSASWDLVITNPPYVRYQRTTRGTTGRVDIPSASDVRRGLGEIVDSRENLSTQERAVFRTLVDGYSGLADLAVPSWLLCAALVAQEGRLAMVVPDTWLSRDYSLPVLYVLRRFFEIEAVVEDGEASWFEDALVRTTLVVARRVVSRPSALGAELTDHVHARLTSVAASEHSLVGQLHPRSPKPELRFAAGLRKVARTGASLQVPGLQAEPATDLQFRDRLMSQSAATTWGRLLEPEALSSGGSSRTEVPRLLHNAVGEIESRLCTLDELGWRVGQGLRTGANRFFYSEVLQSGEDHCTIRVDSDLSSDPISVPAAVARVVVRKQADLAVAGGDAGRSPGRVIILDDYALDEDIAAAGAAFAPYDAMPSPLADHVRRAAELEVGSDAEPRRLPELSAVVTNVRPADPARPGRSARFWYQLPPIAPRHTGRLFVARINYGHPAVNFNADGVVVDANFSTLWPAADDALSDGAMAAVLGSTWALAALEASGTVLGGGALKIEATQLRRLPLPRVSASTAERLAELGLEVVAGRGAAARAEIDAVIASELRLSGRAQAAIDALRTDLLQRRNPRVSPALDAGVVARGIHTSADCADQL